MKKTASLLLILSSILTIKAQQTDSIIDIRDDQVYKVINIVQEWWMQENLNIGIRINKDQAAWNNGVIEKYCYDDLDANCDTFGGFYRWDEMMNYNYGNPTINPGICPVGWFLPADGHWQNLENNLGMDWDDIYLTDWRGTDEGGKMKETSDRYWISPNTGATNESGFTALPAGTLFYDSYGNFGYNATFWTTTEHTSGKPWMRLLSYNHSDIYRQYPYYKNYGLSVRCIRNTSNYNYLIISDKNLKTITRFNFSDENLNDTIILINSSAGQSINVNSIQTNTSLFLPGKSDAFLAQGDSIHLNIAFVPPVPDKGKEYLDTLKITSDDPYQPLTLIPLNGLLKPDSIIDIRDGQIYHVVKIGKQWWMRENLNFGIRIDADQNPANNGVTEKYCYIDNEDYCEKRGGLYHWDEMMDYSPSDNGNPGKIRGACPIGWHLPTDEEWKEFEIFLGMNQVDADNTGLRGTDEGGKMKATGTFPWNSPNTGATNESGFTALPQGYRKEPGTFHDFGYKACLWTSTVSNSNFSWNRMLEYNNSKISRTDDYEYRARSVRCLRDSSQFGFITVSKQDFSAAEIMGFTDEHLTDKLILINSGAGHTINVTSIQINTSAFNLDKSEVVLTPGDSIHLNITFKPTDKGKPYLDTLKILSDDPYRPLISVPLEGYVKPDSIIDIRDGQVYKIIKIGEQWWMRENLNVGTMIDSTQDASDNEIIEKYCYRNSDSLCNIYGGLYQWNEMMDYDLSDDGNPGITRGICPAGWHLSTDNEWTELTDFLGGESVAGEKLKETGTIHWLNPNTGATNESGFTALPGGFRYDNGQFSSLSYYSYWWSSTDNSLSGAWYRRLFYDNTTITSNDPSKNFGFSVRCMTDLDQFSYLKVSDKNLRTISKIDFEDGRTADTIIIINSGAGKTINVTSFHITTSVFNLTKSSVILTPGDSIYVNITFNPPNKGIYYSDTLFIESDDSFQPLISIPVMGYIPDTDSIVDIRDKQVYKIVKIGQQWWMQENLNIGTRINISQNATDNGVLEKYCYDDDPDNCETYGGIYRWNEMMDYDPSDDGNPGITRGICPAGWHLPTDGEWTELIDFLGGGSVAGGKLKQTGTTHWTSPNTGATNESGFTALPGGCHYVSGQPPVGYYAYFWSSTMGSGRAWDRRLSYNSSEVIRSGESTPGVGEDAFSVRCLRDSSQFGLLTILDKYLKPFSKLVFTTEQPSDTIVLLNSTAGDTITISSIHTGGSPFNVSRQSATLFPGDSINLILTFDPTEKSVYDDSLVIISDNPFSPLITISLLGSYPLEIAFTYSTNISCSGYADGIATITPSGGIPPFTYQWDEHVSEDSTITGLSAHKYYHVTVTDAHGSSVSDSIILTEPEPVMANPSFSDTICLNSTKGYINLNPSGGVPPYKYFWSTGDTVQSLTGLGTGNYSIKVTDSHGCIDSASFDIYAAVPYDGEQICIVTVDLLTGRNLIIWEKTPGKGIAYYKLYRENTLIGTVGYNDLSIFEDTVADPEKRPYLYKISVVDTCGNESAQSHYHKPLFLHYVSTDIGVNLEWSKYEIEGEVINFNSYSIYRGSDSTILSPLEEDIPTEVDVYTDNDQNALERKYYYRVAGVLTVPCIPTGAGKKADSGPYSHSMSNMEDNRLQETPEGIARFNENKFNIIPNPFNETTTLMFHNPEGHAFTLYITDLSGKVCRIVENINTSEYVLKREGLKGGFYFVELRGPKLYRGRMVIE